MQKGKNGLSRELQKGESGISELSREKTGPCKKAKRLAASRGRKTEDMHAWPRKMKIYRRRTEGARGRRARGARPSERQRIFLGLPLRLFIIQRIGTAPPCVSLGVIAGRRWREGRHYHPRVIVAYEIGTTNNSHHRLLL